MFIEVPSYYIHCDYCGERYSKGPWKNKAHAHQSLARTHWAIVAAEGACEQGHICSQCLSTRLDRETINKYIRGRGRIPWALVNQNKEQEK